MREIWVYYQKETPMALGSVLAAFCPRISGDICFCCDITHILNPTSPAPVLLASPA